MLPACKVNSLGYFGIAFARGNFGIISHFIIFYAIIAKQFISKADGYTFKL